MKPGIIAGAAFTLALAVSTPAAAAEIQSKAPANIAEGCGTSSRRETVRCLEIASGSAMETEHHLQIASDVGFLTPTQRDKMIEQCVAIQRMLRSLIMNLPQ